MSSSQNPTSELQAVNAMLATIGERPVNALGEAGRLDVVRAENTLDEESKAIQQVGWWFNLEKQVTMAVTGAGEVLIPGTALDIQEYDQWSSNRWVYRGDDGVGKLYDMKERAFDTFAGKTVILNITYCLAFNNLPQPARLAIFRRAGVTFQMRTIASRVLEAFTEREATKGWAGLLDAEIKNLPLTLEHTDGVIQATHNR